MLRLDYINQFGPIDAWLPQATILSTNTSQKTSIPLTLSSHPGSTECSECLNSVKAGRALSVSQSRSAEMGVDAIAQFDYLHPKAV
jgi:hypothetical protein